MSKSKLHEILAVENTTKKKAGIILAETKKTFQEKKDHFDGLERVYHPLDDNGDMIAPEVKELVTTVGEKLDYTKKTLVSSIDVTLAKEATNSSGIAKAELKIGDNTFGELSATSLLALEQNLTQVRDLFKTIPTLDPTKVWVPADDRGEGIFRTNVEKKYRSVKKPTPMVMYEATKEHPAQVQILNEDVRVGHYEATYYSGRITPAKKAEILERVDTLISAVIKARCRANNVDVVDLKIGNKIFDYILKG